MKSERAPLLLHDRLAGLAAFLPVLQAQGFEFGRWGGGEKNGDDVITMPYFALSEQAAEFVRAAYDLGWVLMDFDWPRWKHTLQAQRLRDDPEALAKASPQQLAQLLTVCIRQDRFVEGGLAADFESGLLTAVLTRVCVLLARFERDRVKPQLGDGVRKEG